MALRISSRRAMERPQPSPRSAAAQRYPPLQLGSKFTIWPPVVLAPMAGITNAPFRTLCRRFGGGLYVSEMIGARALVEEDGRAGDAD